MALEQNSSLPGELRSLTRSTVHGVLWITAGRVAKTPVSLLALAILARLLTPSDFGVVAVGMIIVTLSNVLVDGSFGMVLIQRKSIDAAVIGASLALSSGLAVLFSAAIVVSAPFVEQEFDFPQLSEVLLFLGAILPITAITTVTTALLQRSFRFGALTVIQLLSQLAYTIVGITLALAGMGLWSLVWAQITSFIVEALMGLMAVRTQYRLAISTSAVREVFGFGGMFTVSRLLNWASNNVDRVIIGRLFGAAELGFYTRATMLMKTARQLTGTGPIRVLFSSFAKIQDNPARMRKGYLRALSITLLLAALVATFVIVNAEVIIRIVLGPQWLSAVPLVQILFFAFLARSAYVVAEAVPLALGLSGQSALRHGAQLVLVVAGAALGAQFGITGAVVGVASAYWLFYLLVLLLVQRLLQPGWLNLLRLHVNAILVTLVPVVAALATRWSLPGDDFLLQVVPAVTFAVTALIVLTVAPKSLIGEDLVAARNKLRERLSRQLASRVA